MEIGRNEVTQKTLELEKGGRSGEKTKQTGTRMRENDKHKKDEESKVEKQEMK